jgi:hypothetical protein
VLSASPRSKPQVHAHSADARFAQPKAATVFARTLETGNVGAAQGMARELGRISLAEALELTILIAKREPRRHPRIAVAVARALSPGVRADAL